MINLKKCYISLLDLPEEITISSDSTLSEIEENTEVQFTCTTDAYPQPVLTLWSTDGDQEYQVSAQEMPSSPLTAGLNLRRQHNQVSFFCRAQAPDQSYTLDSEKLTYSVKCMCVICLFYSIYIHFCFPIHLTA